MLRFAILGCGRISQRHSDLLGNSQIEGAELIAVADSKFDKAKILADKKMLRHTPICTK